MALALVLFLVVVITLYAYNPYSLMDRFGASSTTFVIVSGALLVCGLLGAIGATKSSTLPPGMVAGLQTMLVLFVIVAMFYNLGLFSGMYAPFWIGLALIMGGVAAKLFLTGPAWVQLASLVASVSVLGFVMWATGAFAADQSVGGYIWDALLATAILALLYKAFPFKELMSAHPASQTVLDTMMYLPCKLSSATGSIADTLYQTSVGRVVMDSTSWLASCVAVPMLGMAKESFSLSFSASRHMWGLLAFEAVLITAWFTQGMAKRAWLLRGTRQLQDAPLLLTSEHTLGTYADLNGEPAQDETMTPVYSYALSLWLRFEAVPPSFSTYVPVLSYGGTPLIEYNAKQNTVRVSVAGGTEIMRRTVWSDRHVRLQRWNHFVVNMSHGTMDLFYNGELVASAIEVVPYQRFDALVCGHNENGVLGEICNVMYYTHPLRAARVQEIWEEFGSRSPPTAPRSRVFGVTVPKMDNSVARDLHDWYTSA
jgi:hypothetical protein